MSTEQVDPQAVEQVKQQIRGLITEITELSKRDLTVREFYSQFLDRVVSALQSAGGAVWTRAEAGNLELMYQINLQETRLAENQEALAQHGAVLHKVLNSGEGALVAPQSGAGEDGQAGNPSDFLLVLSPVKVDQEVKGIIEVFQRPNSRPTTQRGYLKFLGQMCELAADYLKTRQLRHFTDRQALWNQLEHFVRSAHQSLDPRATAFTIANEGRRLIECDRLSVAIKHGRKCRIESVSGQDTFDKRSTTITLLNKLASAVVASGDTLWYMGDATDLAPQVEQAVQEYVDESHTKCVAVVPLRKPVPGPLEREEDDPTEGEAVGALIVELIEDRSPREGMVQRVSVVSDHSSTALANAIEHDSLFLMPLWRQIGKARWVINARTLPKTIAAASAIALATLALIFIPANFEIEGRGTLEPVIKREVFAAQDGIVNILHVRQGDHVKQGQLLAELDSSELNVAKASLVGEHDAAESTLSSVKRTLSDRNAKLTTEEREKLQGERFSLEAKVKSLEQRIDLQNEKLAQLKIYAPIDGEVTTWNLHELLLKRPVQKGQILLTVADTAQDWQLEVHIPEKKMGYVAQAHALSADPAAGNTPAIPVRYILKTDPDQKHTGKVVEMHGAAEVHGEEGNTVLARVAIDKNDLSYRRPGAEVVAHLSCGRRSVGFVYLHPVVDWFYQNVVFRWL